MSDPRTNEELVEEVARGLRAGYVGGFCPACGAADPFDDEHRAECIFGAGFAAATELARRLEAAETALDVLSRWPPGDGMLAMCQYARAALRAAEGDTPGPAQARDGSRDSMC